MSGQRVYIAGVISDGGSLSEAAMQTNLRAFYDRARWLTANGYEPLNPCDTPGEPDWSWPDWTRAGLRMLLDASAISLLPGWDQSRGARLEWEVARALDYPVVGP